MEWEEKTIYMDQIREISLKRGESRLSETPNNHTLTNEEIPHEPYPLKLLDLAQASWKRDETRILKFLTA